MPPALPEDHPVQLRLLTAALIVLAILSVLVWRGQEAPADSGELHPPERLVLDSLGPNGVMGFSYGLPGKSVHLQRTPADPEDAERLLALGIGERNGALPEPSSVYLWEVSFDDSPEPRLADLDRTALAEQALRDLRLVSEMDAPADLRPFGLTRDGVRLDVLDASARRHRYEVGGLSPDGEKRYLLHRASDRLLLVKGDSLAIFEEDPWALVDGRLLPIDPLSIREIRVEGPDRGLPIKLERRSEDWFIEGSISVPAGTSEVRDFLRRAASLSVDTPTQPDAPQGAALSLLVRDGEGVSARLDFSPLPKGRLWVAHASGELLPARAQGRTFLVERAATELLRVTQDAFLPGASAAADAAPGVER